MNAPRILSMTQALRTAPALVQRALRAGALQTESPHFVVTVGGDLNGLYVERGAVLICEPVAGSSRGPVVLLPKGHGRPCVGQIQGNTLLGEHGEPCSPRRWQVSGAIVQVLQVAKGEPVRTLPVPQCAQQPAPTHAALALGRWAEPQRPSQVNVSHAAPAPYLVAQPMLSQPQPSTEPAPQLSLFARAA